MISFFLWVRRNEGRMEERCLGAGRGNVSPIGEIFLFRERRDDCCVLEREVEYLKTGFDTVARR